MVARVFPRCKPNRIPDKMPENKMSEDGKPDKMPDSVCRLVRENCPTDLQNWEFFLGVIDSSMGFVRKKLKFYIS